MIVARRDYNRDLVLAHRVRKGSRGAYCNRYRVMKDCDFYPTAGPSHRNRNLKTLAICWIVCRRKFESRSAEQVAWAGNDLASEGIC